MALTINTNVASMNAQRSLGTTQSRLDGNLGRLSSGQRINTAADDSAGLAISERFKSQIRGLGQAERNANDGVSMLQTAEGALNEISGVLTRMRELAVQSANGTLGSQERVYIENENAALQAEITRISDVTEFNGTKLLDGTLSTAAATLQVGTSASSTNQISFNIQNSDFTTLAGAAVSLSTQTNAQTALTTLDTAINSVSTIRAGLGTVQNRLNVTVANLGSARENISAANSRIRDVDVAAETADLTRNNILIQAGVAVLAQANQAPQVALNLLRG
jgi:flagellin